jgi:uridine phosphorylase
MFSDTDLILNKDGSVYHLGLLPEQLAPIVITVGDPDRVGDVSERFDSVECRVHKREFITHTGRLGDKRISVISTGIGTDNIDIVLNELHILANVDLATRSLKETHTSLDILRIGTSGSIREEVGVDSYSISDCAVGLDALMQFYEYETSNREILMGEALVEYFEQKSDLFILPYVADASKELVAKFDDIDFKLGISVTCPGFYGPQGRKIGGRLIENKLIHLLSEFKYKRQVLTNIEMETAGIYGLARMFGHRAISFNAILANRVTGKFSSRPKEAVDVLIENVLAGI